MTLPNRFWMPENPKGRPYVTQGPLAAAPYVECVRVDGLPGWQPIETAPKDSGDYLVFNVVSEEMFVAYRYGGKGDWWFSDRHKLRDAPTHWMPLPEPPT